MHFYYITDQNQHRDKINNFFDSLATGAGLLHGDPALALCNRVMPVVKSTSRDRQAFLVKAIRAHCNGGKVEKLLWRRKKFPKLAL